MLLALYRKRVSPALSNVLKLASYSGIDIQSGDAQEIASLNQVALGQTTALVVDLSETASSGTKEISSLFANLKDKAAFVLVLVTDLSESAADSLRELTGGAIESVSRSEQASSIATTDTELMRGPLGFVNFAKRFNQPSLHLALREGAATDSLMTLDGRPIFVHHRVGDCRLFVWAARQVLDVAGCVDSEGEIEGRVDEYLPALIFLRAAFGERCWHNPYQAAGIIIDDPLVRLKYGFIRFPDLLNSARRHNYHVSIAFIPWNWRRSSKRAVELFRNYGTEVSLCVHGCDHINNEYGVTDYDLLVSKCILAVERLSLHRDKTGIKFCPVLVFPQGRFSVEAVRAIADCGQFFAAVNTTFHPILPKDQRLPVEDLLLPAFEHHCGFPIFRRRHSDDIGGLALDLFLGKPALMVEHHKFFQRGCGEIEEFCREIARLSKEPIWGPLGDILPQTHLRRLRNGRTDIRFFTNVFRLDHRVDDSTTYRLKKKVLEDRTIKGVLVDGKAVDFRRDRGELTFEVNLQKQCQCLVTVQTEQRRLSRSYSFGLKYQAKVVFRRSLAEFRDNYLSRSQVATMLGQEIVRRLKMTGDSVAKSE